MSLFMKILCGTAIVLCLLVVLGLLVDILTDDILEAIDNDNKHTNQ